MKCKILSINHKPSDWERKALDFYLKQIPKIIKISFSIYSLNKMGICAILQALMRRVLVVYKEIHGGTDKADIIPGGGFSARNIQNLHFY